MFLAFFFSLFLQASELIMALPLTRYSYWKTTPIPDSYFRMYSKPHQWCHWGHPETSLSTGLYKSLLCFPSSHLPLWSRLSLQLSVWPLTLTLTTSLPAWIATGRSLHLRKKTPCSHVSQYVSKLAFLNSLHSSSLHNCSYIGTFLLPDPFC